MKNRTPPNFPSLISQGIELLRGLGTLARADVSYFELGASIVAIRNLNEREPWFAAEELKTLGHNGSKRSNASIGFALASLPTSWMTSDNRSYWGFMQWSPLSTAAPSTMEALAQAAFAGAASFSKVPGIVWSALSLESKVLIGFCEATRKTPQKGYEILRDVIEELKQSYGSGSMEFLLSGTTLVNCCNKVYGGKVGEEIGCVILQSLHGSDSLPLEVEFPQQTYYLMAIADAFLGQGNYDEAERLLLRVIEYLLTDNETAMSAKLRLLKMSRRQRRSPLNLDDWKRLRRLADGFHQAPDSLKYEILEELICFLSVLDPKDIPRSPLEPLVFEIVKSMSTFPISEYGGSLASRENLINNIEALQQYKNELNLFSLSGPQLYFCRKIRDRFRHAAVQVAERVGAANWQRFQRIKEMWEESDSSEEIVAQHEIPDTGKSKFYDSGIGSSVGSESKQIGELDSGVPQGARSVLSIRSFMQNEFGATELPPIPVENAEGNRICFICRKILKGVNSESQWRSVVPDTRRQ
jgi:tetratricopeptide (TPR) repeat protein